MLTRTILDFSDFRITSFSGLRVTEFKGHPKHFFCYNQNHYETIMLLDDHIEKKTAGILEGRRDEVQRLKPYLTTEGSNGMVALKEAPLKNEEKSRGPVVMGRRKEFNIQLNQLVDAVLLHGVALASLCVLRFELGENFDSIPAVESLRMFTFGFSALIIPFGPLLLDLNSFYDYPLQKTFIKTVGQAGLALLWLAILICGCAIFFRLNLSSRSVLLLFWPHRHWRTHRQRANRCRLSAQSGCQG